MCYILRVYRGPGWQEYERAESLMAESETQFSAVPVTAHRKKGQGGIAPPANRTMRREGDQRSFKWCKEVSLYSAD